MCGQGYEAVEDVEEISLRTCTAKRRAGPWFQSCLEPVVNKVKHERLFSLSVPEEIEFQ